MILQKTVFALIYWWHPGVHWFITQLGLYIQAARFGHQPSLDQDRIGKQQHTLLQCHCLRGQRGWKALQIKGSLRIFKNKTHVFNGHNTFRDFFQICFSQLMNWNWKCCVLVCTVMRFNRFEKNKCCHLLQPPSLSAKSDKLHPCLTIVLIICCLTLNKKFIAYLP